MIGKEAMFYERLSDNKVRCYLCGHNCLMADSELGVCRVRKNEGGVLNTLVYGKVAAANIDPVEKKPLYHFLPGTRTFSIATPGCNFKCGFCQNWQISQADLTGCREWGKKLSPEEIVEKAKKSSCQSISFTYTEPTIFFEYAYDIARIAKEQGLFTTFVTNGYMSLQAIKKIRPYLDAANIDLKSFRDEFYRNSCKARLEPVLTSIKAMKDSGIWIEITTLVIPGYNSSSEELKDTADFVASQGIEIPWHISRFHPDYGYLDAKVTPLEKLREAASLAGQAGLRYVYLGNIEGRTDTVCYKCKETLIKRVNVYLQENRIHKGRCPGCGEKVDGVFV